MKVQIIVPSINLWSKYTKPCLDSILEAMVSAKSHGIDCRILLIDNASTDETRVEAGKMVSDIFSHHRNEERWGFQRSVNFGVKDAWERGYDYSLVCNNDILMHPEAIWRLTERLNSDTPYRFPRPIEMALYDENVHNSTNDSVLEWPVGMVTAMDVRGEVEPTNFKQMNTLEKKECPDSGHPNFSAFMISKQAWEVVGEMDELFAPAYFEDNDYHYRMNLAEIAAICHPQALFYHFASGTQREAKEDGSPMVTNEQFEKNRANYFRKWGGPPPHEIFTTPYNNPDKDFSTTQQLSTDT
jgi:GT2 family glycosyltransferase